MHKFAVLEPFIGYKATRMPGLEPFTRQRACQALMADNQLTKADSHWQVNLVNEAAHAKGDTAADTMPQVTSCTAWFAGQDKYSTNGNKAQEVKHA